MSLATVYSRANFGVTAPLVTVEIHISKGLPGFSIVGLPEAAVRESRERVRSAIINSGFQFPTKRLTVNLAPADLPKEGGRYDLAIAIGILHASEQIHHLPDNYEFVAELSLDGALRQVRGILPATVQCSLDKRFCVVATDNAEEANLPKQAKVYGCKNLKEIVSHLNQEQRLDIYTGDSIKTEPPPPTLNVNEVQGQFHAKRALTIAAAGNHHLLMIGPPGAGKTMLASRLPSLLPELDEQQALRIASIESIAGQKRPLQWYQPRFRQPHHTASSAALVGGGNPPKPGEISLAHGGVLFLDELPEFNRKVLEVLREPLESGEISIARAARQVTYPAEFQLVAAMNPCPCGYFGDPNHQCHCSQERIQRYQQKISGPLLDRIDLHVEVSAVPIRDLQDTSAKGPSSEELQRLILDARQRQIQRQGCLNAMLSSSQLQEVCQLTETDRERLVIALEKLGLSARAYHRILKIARTIADLNSSTSVTYQHLIEALSFRKLQQYKATPRFQPTPLATL